MSNPVIWALRKLRQQYRKSEISLSYLVKLCQKKKKNREEKLGGGGKLRGPLGGAQL